MRRSGREVLLDHHQGLAHLQHDGGVHDVLGRGTPVHVAPGLAAHLHQLVHERQDRVADDVGLVPQEIEVELVDLRAGGDLLGGFGRDHPTACLGACQRHLDLDVARDQGVVGEDLPHARGAERVAEQDAVEDGGGHGNGLVHGSLLTCTDICLCPYI